ncbi:MAG: HAD superfamily hydrolase, partial [candidate division CPR2 bacterium GW2011_GWD1_39_7]
RKYPQELVDHAFENNLWHDWDKGLVPSKEYWDEFAKILGKRNMRKVKKFMVKNTKLRPRMIDLVKSLKAHYKVGLLSNTVPELKKEVNKLNGLFDEFILSYKVHMRKPDKEIYLLTAEKLDLKPEECLFIDDREYVLDAALECGFEGILFKSEKGLTQELKERQLWNELINI